MCSKYVYAARSLSQVYLMPWRKETSVAVTG